MSPDKPARTSNGHWEAAARVPGHKMMLWFFLIAVLFIACGSFYYFSDLDRIRQLRISGLGAINQIKIKQIQRWCQERSNDARRISDSPAVKRILAEWLRDPERLADREDLVERLQLEQELGIYFQALLVDAGGKILLSGASRPVEMEKESWVAVKKALTERRPVLSQLHYTVSGGIHIDIAAAIRDDANQTLAVLVLTTNVQEYLFPMIEAWPTSSQSGETLLVRRDGDEVLFLNELRHRKNTALRLSFLLSLNTLPAVQAVLGRRGIFYGKDYLGKAVVADLQPIPGTDWFLVTKEDEAEIRGEVRLRAVAVSLAVLILILCVAGGMAFWYRTLQLEARKRTEALLLDSETRYRRLFEAAKDGILILDAGTGMILDANPYLIEMLGYSHKEFLGKAIWDVGCLKDIIANKNNFLKLQQEKYARYEDLPLETADGRKIEVEFVSNVYQVDHRKVIQCNIRDITERKRLKKELAEAKELQFRTLIETLPSKVFLKDKNSVYLSCNENYAKDLGIRSEEIVGKTDYDFFPTHLAEKQRDEDKQIMESGMPEDREEEYHGIRDYLSGSRKSYVHIVKVPVRDGAGHVTGLLGFFWDITERKKIQEELKQQGEVLKEIIDSTPDFIFAKDTELRTILANKAYARAVGKAPKDMIGHTDVENGWDPELVHGNPLKGIRGFENDDRDVLNGNVIHNTHDPANTPEGIRIFDTLKMPLFDTHQKIIGVLGIARDITDRMKTEQELRESKELTEAVVENVPLMIFLKEAKDLRFIIFNRAGEELLGYDRKAVLGKNNLDLFPPEQAAFFAAKDREVLDGKAGMVDIPEEPILTAKKGERLLHTRKVCVRGADGVTKYLLGISEDITEQKILAAEKNRVEVMAAATEAKTKFISMISHELRSPIAVILGALEIALEGLPDKVDDELKEVLAIAKKNSERLIGLISNVLDFQKIESGKMEYLILQNDLHEVMEEIRQSMSVLVKGKGLDLKVEMEKGLPKIKFDRDKLVQVITNLVNNAIRHTQNGDITLAVQKEKDVVHVRVQDTGEGILPEDLPKLFQPFEQVGGLMNRQKGGTGLGLAISKKIILAHHGKIWAESTVGKGSSFHFTLPL
ncbi:MAG: PAS domain S-box protein [Candidatus Omnitrophota bacterium]